MRERETGVLERVEHGNVGVWTDLGLRAATGVIVAFSERTGGVSTGLYSGLNLASHVGDDPAAVDENRARLLDGLGLGDVRNRLTTAEQVHGVQMAWVDEGNAGAGAFATGERGPMRGTDALLTRLAEATLLLLYADCVPVVLVAPGPAVAVVHAGWRGALQGIAGLTVGALVRDSGTEAAEIQAYIGPHIGACHYEVGPDVMSQFFNTFGTVSRARSGGLDLDAAVRLSLVSAGVPQWRITSLGACTAEETERFYSYRAEGGMTGRHGALVCIESRH